MTERPHAIDRLFVLTHVGTFSNIINPVYWKAVVLVLWVIEWSGCEGEFLCRQPVQFTISWSVLLLLHTSLGVTVML